MNEHVAGEVLAAFVDGALDAGLRPGVEAHLSRCPECREALAEVLGMRESREKIPAEFLRRALDVAAADAPGGLRLPGHTTMPARLVFGVAAVFLVVALLGYFFLGRGGMGPVPAAEKALPQSAFVAKDDRPPAQDAGIGEAREETLQRSLPARKARAAEANGLEMEKKSLAEEVQAGPPAAPMDEKAAATPAALPAKTGQAQAAGDEEIALRREAVGGAIGGVLGGVEAPLEKDKESDMKPAAAPAARFKGAGMEDRMQQRPRFHESGTSGDAMQLFLAATGRAAAPRALPAADAPSPPRLRIGGDVASVDLLDPWILDSWDWFPEGRALELTIDAAGAVNAVKLLGNWDGREAERARESAVKLAFRPSARTTRRAVLSR
jgi:hypothetical protein